MERGALQVARRTLGRHRVSVPLRTILLSRSRVTIAERMRNAMR